MSCLQKRQDVYCRGPVSIKMQWPSNAMRLLYHTKSISSYPREKLIVFRPGLLLSEISCSLIVTVRWEPPSRSISLSGQETAHPKQLHPIKMLSDRKNNKYRWWFENP